MSGRNKKKLFSSFVDAVSFFIVTKEGKEIVSSYTSSFVATKEVAMEEEKKEVSSSSFFLTKKGTMNGLR